MKRLFLVLFGLATCLYPASKAYATTATQTYQDCTITYELFGSGNVVIGIVDVSCTAQNHQIRVAVQVSPDGGGPTVQASNSGFSENVGTGTNTNESGGCVPNPNGSCTVTANASFQVTIDSFNTGDDLGISG
jgi:hypothetical protein